MKPIKRLLVPMLFAIGLPIAHAQQSSSSTGQTDDGIVALSPFTVTSQQDTSYATPDTLAGTRMRTQMKDIGAPITELSRAILDDIGGSSLNDIASFLPSVTQDYDVQNDFSQNSLFFDQTYRIRGLQTDTRARNYFNTFVPTDTYNISRITLSRGANSILFGAANPAGIFNVSTEAALLDKPVYELQYRTDKYGTERTSLDANQTLVAHKLAVRLILLNDHSEFWSRPLNYKDQRRAYVAFNYQPRLGTNISGNFENYNYARSAPSQNIPLDRVNLWLAQGQPTRVSNTVTSANPTGIVNASGANGVMGLLGSLPIGNAGSQVIVQNLLRYPISTNSLVGVNNSGAYSLPNSFFGGQWPNFTGNDRIDASRGWVGDLTLEQRLAKNLYVQVAAHGEKQERDLLELVNDWSAYADASTTLQDGVTPNPNVGRYFVGGGNTFYNTFYNTSRQYRATLSYSLDLTKYSPWLGRHEFGALYQIDDLDNEIDRRTLRNTTPLPGYNTSIMNAQNQITAYIYLNPDGSYTGPSRDPRTWESTFSGNGVTARYVRSTAGTNQLSELRSSLAVMQNHWWKDRIITTAGLRHDRQDLWDVDRTTWPKDPLTGEFVAHDKTSRISNPAGSGINDTTYSVGSAIHLVQHYGPIEHISLVYNKSNNFAPAAGARNLQNEIVGPSTGVTEDTGLKVGLYHGRANFSFSRFHSGQLGAAIGQGLWVNINPIWDALNLSEKNLDSKMTDTQDQTAKGYEAEIQLKPLLNWDVAIFASKNDNQISNKWPSTTAYLKQYLPILQDPAYANIALSNGQTVASQLNNYLISYKLGMASEGTRSSNLREWQASIVTNYRIGKSWLKGVGIGGYYRWSSPDIIGYQQLASNSKAFDNTKPYEGRSLSDLGLKLSYTRKFLKTHTWKIQLNIRNLLNNDEPLPIRADQTSLTNTQPIYRIYRLQQPRTWVLTNSISF